MDKHIVDVITDNYTRKYGVDDFDLKKNKKQTDACFRDTMKVYNELQDKLDIYTVHNHIVSSTLLIPEYSRSEKLSQMNRDIIKIKSNLQTQNPYIYREYDTYTYRITGGYIYWNDDNGKAIAKAICTPVCVCDNTVKEFKYRDTYFKYVKLLWSWRDDFIEDWEEMSAQRSTLLEIKKIKKLVKKYKNPKLTCNGLIYSNLIADHTDLILAHAYIYSIWIMQMLEYEYVVCNVSRKDIASGFYIIRNIEKCG